MSENLEAVDAKADAFRAIFGVDPSTSRNGGMYILEQAIVFSRLAGFAREVVNSNNEIAKIALKYKDYKNHEVAQAEMLSDHKVLCDLIAVNEMAYGNFSTALDVAKYYGHEFSENVNDYVEKESKPLEQ